MMDINSLKKFFAKAMAPMKRKVLLMIGRAVLTVVDDAGKIQLCNVNLMADETKDQVEVFNHFGFSSNPPKGSEGVMVSVGGNREHGIIIAHEHRDFRQVALGEGDAILYNKNGKYIHVKGDNIESKLTKLKVENDSNELMAVLSEWMQEVIDGTTVTLIGPQPWTPATLIKLNAVKDKLDTFKV